MWRKSYAATGYGNWYWRGKPGGSHRESFKLFESFDLKLSVLHKCGNKGCCNPNHLYAGTQKQNIADTRRHGRYSPPPYKKGENIATSKLKDSDVKQIKLRIKAGESLTKIATDYKVTVACISLIKKEKNWKWVIV